MTTRIIRISGRMAAIAASFSPLRFRRGAGVVALSLVAGFASGYSYRQQVAEKHEPRITGIGGILFKSKNPAELRAWYSKHFGMNTNQYGTNFEWYQGADSTQKGYTLWAPFKEKTTYFAPSTKEFMINYRVTGLKELLARLAADGIHPTDTVTHTSYGDFVHLMDPENNKIELWEPNDIEYEKLGDGKTGVTR